MKFRKEVEVPVSRHQFSREDKIGVFGSCFAWEVADALYDDLYDVWRSPFGISYNPLSMADQVHRLCVSADMKENELFEHNGSWHSFAHHGSCSGMTREKTLERMQSELKLGVRAIANTRIFVFTWGTAYYYRLVETGEVVNNCHKLPANRFRRERATVEGIVSTWQGVLEELKSVVPGSQFIFTVSPVPHYSDGVHEHTLSKSILHCAMDQLIERYSDHAEYFPSYEIMREELRDYRFYKEDLAHPTAQAVAYIMEKFCRSYTTEDTTRDRPWIRLRGQLQHRPLTKDRTRLREHYLHLLEQVRTLQIQYDHPRLSAEESHLEDLLEQLKKQA